MKKIFGIIKIGRLKRKIIAFLASWHFYGNPSKKLKIVGVTGTNGKTTTATLLYRIATELGHKAGLISTVENIIAGEIRTHSEKAPQTTPDPIRLNKLLTEMAERGCEYVFMEVSSHAMDQKRVAGVKFTGGIFTNLTHDHLDYHKNLENYFSAKKKFFKMLSKKSFALSNADDERGEKILEGIRATKFLYGFGKQEQGAELPKFGSSAPKCKVSDLPVHYFSGEIVKKDFNGIELNINNKTIKSKLLGKFNAYNLLAVYSTAILLGWNPDAVVEILSSIKPPKGRFEHFLSKNKVLAIVDYAHTPDALEKILLAVNEIKSEGSKVIAIFGCGGDRDPIKRPKMGKIGAALSDVPIFTSDNSRSEDPEKIIEQMKTELSKEELKKVISIADRRKAITEAVKLAQPGDIILCAGKGHENYQEIKGVKHPFDDLEELKKALE